ncbi:MAG: PDDEXK nuclease domain-containing protein [Candidatus Obscuribacterales bacterium]|nr:PDDEXK nuclease domain-containing protein [Candidatus Obscuribacterales bacterium]
MKRKPPAIRKKNKSSELIQPRKGHLFERVVSILEQAKTNVVHAVNNNMVVAYWLIGREIVQELQAGKTKAKYGEATIEDLAKQLTNRYGQGYSIPNLKNFRQFYLVYSNRTPEISYTPCSQLNQKQKSYPTGSFFMGFRPNLTWSHYRALMRIEKDKARQFYEEESATCSWSVRELERQIHSFYYERLLVTKDKKSMLQAQRDTKRQVLLPEDILKSPTVLEFLNLPDVTPLHESEFEQAIIDNLQSFLLELGKGFAFVARQQRLRFEDEDFYVDLVFYNYLLKCFILVDLKMGKLTHQDIGQMDSYIRMYKDLYQLKSDNPTIGLILCAKKNETIAKYSVLKESKQLFASKYMLYLPTEKELALELERTSNNLERQ